MRLFGVMWGALALWGAVVAPVAADNRALIISIGAYPAPNSLAGPPTDAEHARFIAGKLGIPPGNIKVLQDGQASHAAITRELRAMAVQAGPRDQIFIHYSGHGAQMRDGESGKATGCTEALVTLEGEHSGYLKDREFKALVDAIAAKASKVVAFIDACHSGGIASTRGLGGTLFKSRSHFTSLPGSQCGVAINATPRSFGERVQDGRANVAVVTAAAQNEVALDGGQQMGGLASLAWRQCLSDPRTDANGSGGLSAEELRACA
jgi:hypothetical protein